MYNPFIPTVEKREGKGEDDPEVRRPAVEYQNVTFNVVFKWDSRLTASLLIF
jgi:hypothetical protein